MFLHLDLFCVCVCVCVCVCECYMSNKMTHFMTEKKALEMPIKKKTLIHFYESLLLRSILIVIFYNQEDINFNC